MGPGPGRARARAPRFRAGDLEKSASRGKSDMPFMPQGSQTLDLWGGRVGGDDGDGGGDDDDGGKLPASPTPPNVGRDNISRKGTPSLRLKIHRKIGFCTIWELGSSSKVQNTPTGSGNDFYTRQTHFWEIIFSYFLRTPGVPLRDIFSLRMLVGRWGWLGGFCRRCHRHRHRAWARAP